MNECKYDSFVIYTAVYFPEYNNNEKMTTLARTLVGALEGSLGVVEPPRLSDLDPV